MAAQTHDLTMCPAGVQIVVVLCDSSRRSAEQAFGRRRSAWARVAMGGRRRLDFRRVKYVHVVQVGAAGTNPNQHGAAWWGSCTCTGPRPGTWRKVEQVNRSKVAALLPCPFSLVRRGGRPTAPCHLLADCPFDWLTGLTGYLTQRWTPLQPAQPAQPALQPSHEWPVPSTW